MLVPMNFSLDIVEVGLTVSHSSHSHRSNFEHVTLVTDCATELMTHLLHGMRKSKRQVTASLNGVRVGESEQEAKTVFFLALLDLDINRLILQSAVRTSKYPEPTLRLP